VGRFGAHEEVLAVECFIAEKGVKRLPTHSASAPSIKAIRKAIRFGGRYVRRPGVVYQAPRKSTERCPAQAGQ
jgi:hypothetical protein